MTQIYFLSLDSNLKNQGEGKKSEFWCQIEKSLGT
jgi:hypothetical protein